MAEFGKALVGFELLIVLIGAALLVIGRIGFPQKPIYLVVPRSLPTLPLLSSNCRVAHNPTGTVASASQRGTWVYWCPLNRLALKDLPQVALENPNLASCKMVGVLINRNTAQLGKTIPPLAQA
jgi:hypothetical protein